MHPALNDTVVLWSLRPAELVHRFLVLADEHEAFGDVRAAVAIRDVLNGDYNPLLDDDTELGDPPTATPRPVVRPAAPDLGIRVHYGDIPPGVRPRRAHDPGGI